MACKIAKIDANLIDESTAMVYGYAYEDMRDSNSKLNRLAPNQSFIIAMIDFGYSKTTITFAKFTRENSASGPIQAQILLKNDNSNQNLGLRDLDLQVLKEMRKDQDDSLE